MVCTQRGKLQRQRKPLREGKQRQTQQGVLLLTVSFWEYVYLNRFKMSRWFVWLQRDAKRKGDQNNLFEIYSNKCKRQLRKTIGKSKLLCFCLDVNKVEKKKNC